MALTSPLGSLIQVLHTVVQEAADNAGLLQKNEAATRAALIDPVLRVLGWDTANVRMVEPEKTVNNAWRADYALLDTTGAPKLLLEAKCLGSNLEKFAMVQQLLGYAFGFGVPSIVMTDGISWHFYHDFKPGHSNSNSSFHLRQDDLQHCAFQLISWLDAAHFGHFSRPQSAFPPLTPPLAKESVTQSTHQAQKQSKAATKATPAATAQDQFVDLTSVNTLQLQPGQKPTQLRLPDGSVKPVKTWKDILLETCQFLLATNPDLKLPLPDKAGKKRFLLANHKPEIGASTPNTYKGKAVFICTNYSATDCIANAIYACSHVPEPQKSQTPAIRF